VSGAGPAPAGPRRPVRVFTIGHSTRELNDFIALLEREGIRRLVDVRSFPASRRHPHFNRDALAAALAARGIAYEHARSLGGLRKARPDTRNTAWRNDGFRGYADHMETAEFREALTRLEQAAAAEPTTVMCAEAVPWRCHRNLLSDALVARGDEVLHIMDAGTSSHTLTSFARVEDGEVRYATEQESAEQRDLFAPDETAGRP
jgi:uncharacterized protein (DUF488 family)